MRTRGRSETTFSGIGKAKAKCTGRLVRTVPNEYSTYYTFENEELITFAVTPGRIFYGNNTVLIVSVGSGNYGYRSVGGGAWEDLTGVAGLPWGDSAFLLYDDVNSCWVASVDKYTDGTRPVYRSTDNGSTWSASGVGTLPASGAWISCNNKGRVVAVRGTQSFYTTDGGLNWTEGGALTTGTNGIGCALSTGIFVSPIGVGNNCNISENGGLTWQVVNSGMDQGGSAISTGKNGIAFASQYGNYRSITSKTGKTFEHWAQQFSGLQLHASTSTKWMAGTRDQFNMSLLTEDQINYYRLESIYSTNGYITEANGVFYARYGGDVLKILKFTGIVRRGGIVE